MEFLERIPLFSEFYMIDEAAKHEMTYDLFLEVLDLIFCDKNFNSDPDPKKMKFKEEACQFLDGMFTIFHIYNKQGYAFVCTEYLKELENISKSTSLGDQSKLDKCRLAKRVLNYVPKGEKESIETLFINEREARGRKTFRYIISNNCIWDAIKEPIIEHYKTSTTTGGKKKYNILSYTSSNVPDPETDPIGFEDATRKGELNTYLGDNIRDLYNFLSKIKREKIGKEEEQKKPIKKDNELSQPMKILKGKTVGGFFIGTLGIGDSSEPAYAFIAPFREGFQYSADDPDKAIDRSLGLSSGIVTDAFGETVVSYPSKRINGAGEKYFKNHLKLKEYALKELGIKENSNLFNSIEIRKGDLSNNLFGRYGK